MIDQIEVYRGQVVKNVLSQNAYYIAQQMIRGIGLREQRMNESNTMHTHTHANAQTRTQHTLVNYWSV